MYTNKCDKKKPHKFSINKHCHVWEINKYLNNWIGVEYFTHKNSEIVQIQHKKKCGILFRVHRRFTPLPAISGRSTNNHVCGYILSHQHQGTLCTHATERHQIIQSPMECFVLLWGNNQLAIKTTGFFYVTLQRLTLISVFISLLSIMSQDYNWNKLPESQPRKINRLWTHLIN